MKKGYAIWVTGLPGSGKTTVAKKLFNELKKKTKKIEYLRLDAFRKKVIIHPGGGGQYGRIELPTDEMVTAIDFSPKDTQTSLSDY